MGFVTILDEAASGEKFGTHKLKISTEKVTLRDLIQQRIRQEVEEFNRSQSDVFSGLIQPTDTERVLNGYRLKARRELSWENQFESSRSV
jgi:hypothetical protein